MDRFDKRAEELAEDFDDYIKRLKDSQDKNPPKREYVYEFFDVWTSETVLFNDIDGLMDYWKELMKKDERYMEADKIGIHKREVKTKDREIKPGQIYKFDGEGSYMLAKVSIAHCPNYALVNLDTGEIGPLYDKIELCIEDFELYAESISDLQAKLTSTPEGEHEN